MHRIALAILLCSALAARARAQDAPPRCQFITVPGAIDECVRSRLDSVERQLRATVGRALESLPDSSRRSFLMAHAAWEQYRLDECRSVAAERVQVTIGERGYIECLGLLAHFRTQALVTIYGFHRLDHEGPGGCVGYEPDTVHVAGVLERHVYAGPPNYRSITRGDARRIVYMLRLDDGLCVSRNLSAANVVVAGVRRVQLELDEETRMRLRSREGQRLTLSGTLRHAFTARHRASVLLRPTPAN